MELVQLPTTLNGHRPPQGTFNCESGQHNLCEVWTRGAGAIPTGATVLSEESSDATGTDYIP